MVKDFIEYTFNSDTVSYPTSYDSSKINLGYLMKKSVDSNDKTYVSPLEPVFGRGYENYTLINSVLGSLTRDVNTIWVFHSNGALQNVPKRIFLSEYNISANTLTEIGSITTNASNPVNHDMNSLTPSLEFHTGGTVSVSNSGVTGNSTSWVTNGVCVGNRIGFGSNNPTEITTWYEISSVFSNTYLSIKTGVSSDGSVNGLSISAGTPYVIEDLRLMYANYGNGFSDRRGVYLVKGLRKEIFNSSITNIEFGNITDNIRACYRLMDNSTINATYGPNSFVLDNKVSLTEQYGYSLTNVNTTTFSVQKFNVRSPLILGAGRVTGGTSYLLSTGSQSTSSTILYNSYNISVLGPNNSIYVTCSTKMSRVPLSAVTSGSTTFIRDDMNEVPPGGVNTFAATSTMDSSHYMPIIDRFYINNRGGNKNYVTPYVSGSTQFERMLHVNDVIQQGSYLNYNFDVLTPHTLSNYFNSTYSSGISFLSRIVASDNNLIYGVPLVADKQYSDITNSFVITPSITTLSAVTYDKVYFDVTDTWSSDRLVYPREIFDAYYRISGITDNSGSWTLISQNGSMSGVTSSEVQFKFTFRTIGMYCVPTRVHGLTLTYSANTIPVSTAFYEPSLKYTNINSKIFAWRQRDNFENNIPNLKLDIYNVSNNNLLLTDDVNSSSNGVWQYSTDGSTWNSWSSSADTIGNYIRYSATTLSANGLKIKPILYT